MESRSRTVLMAEIFTRLKVEMNGAVVGSMEDRGLNYILSYGVSIPTIRNVAKEYAPNHPLARLLYKQQIRELQLAAICIADPNEINVDNQEFWSKGIVTNELAENFGSLLLAKSCNVLNIAHIWLESQNTLVVYSALLALARAMRDGRLVDSKECLEVCIRLLDDSEQAIWRGVGLVLVAISKQNQDDMVTVVEFLKSVKNMKLSSAKYLENEVAWQLA